MVRGNVNQQRVKNFIERIPWQAKQLVRGVPGIPSLDVRILRASLMLEECLETIQKGLGLDIILDVVTQAGESSTVRVDFNNIDFVGARDPNIVEIADGLADQEVVNLGCAESCNIDLQPVFDTVMDNNDEKIQTGSFNAIGKLVKHKDHKPPDIAAVLRDQGWGRTDYFPQE